MLISNFFKKQKEQGTKGHTELEITLAEICLDLEARINNALAIIQLPMDNATMKRKMENALITRRALPEEIDKFRNSSNTDEN